MTKLSPELQAKLDDNAEKRAAHFASMENAQRIRDEEQEITRNIRERNERFAQTPAGRQIASDHEKWLRVAARPNSEDYDG